MLRFDKIQLSEELLVVKERLVEKNDNFGCFK